MSIIPPPHPRSPSQPPPLLRRLVDEAEAKLAEEDPAGEEPTLVKIPKLEEFVPDEVEITPLRHDYPPADLQAYRRSVPAIPPPPATDYSSWPPTVLETGEKVASFGTNALDVAREYLEELRDWSLRTFNQARAIAGAWRSQIDQIEERWGSGWVRAATPYAVGTLSVLALAGLFLPTLASGSKAPRAVGSEPAASIQPSSIQTRGSLQSTPTASSPATALSSAASTSPSTSSPVTPGPVTPGPVTPGQRQSPPRLSTEAILLLALAENLMDAGRDAEAVPVLERALARTAGVANDPTFLRIVKRGALSEDRLAAAQIHGLLIGPMGERGAEILYEISTSNTARKGVRDRANSFVYTKEFENKAPLPLYTAFKLLTAPTCESKKSLLAFAAEAGGRHALDYLRELDEHKVCSLDDFDNCYPCMNLDDALPRAIEKIEKRLGM